jgi:hypothetical protein
MRARTFTPIERRRTLLTTPTENPSRCPALSVRELLDDKGEQTTALRCLGRGCMPHGRPATYKLAAAGRTTMFLRWIA